MPRRQGRRCRIPRSPDATRVPGTPRATASARSRVSGSNTENSFADQQDQHRVERRHHIVEHDPEAAGDTTLDGPDRPGLGDIEQPEQQERGGIPAPIQRYGQQHEPLRRHLVDYDKTGILLAAGSGDAARRPATERENYYRRRGKRNRATNNSNCAGTRNGGQGSPCPRRWGQQPDPEPRRDQCRRMPPRQPKPCFRQPRLPIRAPQGMIPAKAGIRGCSAHYYPMGGSRPSRDRDFFEVPG
jgi:hypothetical protein